VTAENRRHLIADNGITPKSRDVVATHARVARAIVERYRPSGRVLDPCAGDGAFRDLIPGCLWCEIAVGRDFFSWGEPVDWIIGNPPYSILNRWLEHSFVLANDVVYLLPIAKVFGSRVRLRQIARYGGIVEIWAPWTGRDVGFALGWACGAVHFRRGHGKRLHLSGDVGGGDTPHLSVDVGVDDVLQRMDGFRGDLGGDQVRP
jgi:hypothetical protein